MFDIRAVIKAVQTLIRVKVLVSLVLVGIILALCVVIVLEWGQLNKIRKDLSDLIKKYGNSITVIDDTEAKLSKVQDDKIKLQSDIIDMIKKQEEDKKIEKKKNYCFGLRDRLIGLYGAWGMHRKEKDLETAVDVAFSASMKLWEKGEIKYYAKSPRQTALRLLGEGKSESDYTFQLICQNYLKDKYGNYIMEDENRKIEKVKTGSDYYDWYVVEGGKKTISYEYVVKSGKRAIRNKDGTWTLYYREKGDEKERVVVISFEELKKHLIKTTKDYGWLQVNDCNVNWTLARLTQLGLWSDKWNRWLLDPEICAMMRLLVDEKRVIDKMDKKDDGRWDKNVVFMLERVSGWEGIYAE